MIVHFVGYGVLRMVQQHVQHLSAINPRQTQPLLIRQDGVLFVVQRSTDRANDAVYLSVARLHGSTRFAISRNN